MSYTLDYSNLRIDRQNRPRVFWVEGLTASGEGTFEHCEALTNLTVPDTLTDIGLSMLDEHGENLTVTCSEGSAMENYLKKYYPEVQISY